MADGREISIFSGVDAFFFDGAEIVSLFSLLDSTKFKIPNGELSIAFLSQREMCRVHGEFLRDDMLTDVITFRGDGEMDFAGEICVSPDYALANHEIHATTFSEELTLYLIHGYLHLHGLNDISESEVERMREGERLCMALVRCENLLPKFLYENRQIH
jgi:probable rRNA maturation factor